MGLDTADAIIDGEAAGDMLGAAVSAAGDIDGDGIDDFALGAPGNDRTGTYAGRAYLFHGPLAGTVDADDAEALLDGAASGDQAGTALAGGLDVDDDGTDDLCVGMPAYDGGGTNSGGIAVLLGDFSGRIALDDADTLVIGENPGDQVGYAFSTAGDVDSDGNTDLLVGSFSSDRDASNGGTAFLLYGPLAGGAISLSSSDAFFTGAEAGAYVGWPVSGGGDHDGNGSDDLLLGARYSDVGASDAGAAFLHYAGL